METSAQDLKTSLTMSSEALAAIRAHGQAAYPLECCGALVGGGDVVVEAWPLPNTSGENQQRRFLVSPSEYRALEQRVAAAGRTLLGFYHSHPDHPARPSEHDLAAAWPSFMYAILSIRGGTAAELTIWRLRDDRSAFGEVAVLFT
jgi:proteasome lid subunit RPN8/RPN11